MDTGTKFELMQTVVKQLEDLKNNQLAILEKIGQLENANLQLADTQLEMKLDDLYESVAMNVEKAKVAFSFYSQKFGPNIKKFHKIFPLFSLDFSF